MKKIQEMQEYKIVNLKYIVGGNEGSGGSADKNKIKAGNGGEEAE